MMIHADKGRALMHPEQVTDSTRRLRYLLASLEEELLYHDTQHALKEHLRTLRIDQENPQGERYWTLVDEAGTVFELVESRPAWKVYVESGLADKQKEHLLESLVKLSARINFDVQHNVA